MNLPLIPVEQFLAEHPEHADADEKALMIARIDHEHAGRVALEEQRQALLKKRQGLIAENKKRKDDLANLDKDLEKFIDVCWKSLYYHEAVLTRCNRPQNQSKKLSRRWSEAGRKLVQELPDGLTPYNPHLNKASLWNR